MRHCRTRRLSRAVQRFHLLFCLLPRELQAWLGGNCPSFQLTVCAVKRMRCSRGSICCIKRLGAAKKNLCLVAGVGTTVTFGVNVAAHEEPELYECRQLGFGCLSWCVECELGAQAAAIPYFACYFLFGWQHVACACFVVCVYEAAQTEDGCEHKHLKWLQSVVSGATVIVRVFHSS